MTKKILLVASILFTAVSFSVAGVHQRADGSAAYSNGKNALSSGKVEVKAFGGLECARVTSKMTQWGFVTYWMGIPTPTGSSVIRFKLYNAEGSTAKYLVYVRYGEGADMVGKLAIPAGTAVGKYVTVDIPVESAGDWSGIVVKKADTSENPSPWIQSVSVVLK